MTAGGRNSSVVVRCGRRALLVFAAVLMALALLPACSASRPILKVGLSAPFTGWDEQVGYSVIHAVRLALRESYQRGGAGGYMLELVALDDKNDPAEAAQQARELAIDPDVLAAMGGLDNEAALAAAPGYDKAGMAFVTIGATAHALTDGGSRTAFRLAPRDESIARAAADFARDRLQARRAALIEDPAEEGLAAAMAAAARANGMSIVHTGGVRRWQLDFAGLAAGVRAAQPDLVLFAGRVSEAGPLVAALRAAGVAAPFVGGAGVDDPRMGRLVGEAMEGVYAVGLAAPVTTGAFSQAYAAAAGYPAGARAALAHDAATLLIAAVERAARSGQPTRASVLAELVKTMDHLGLTGAISFDAQGQNTAARPAIYALRGLTYPGAIVP